MIAKEKMFIVASNIDDSVKSVTPVYDITIFPDFLKFEEYINKTPDKIGSIIISSRELPFTGVNMGRLIDCLNAPFLRLTGNCIYLIDDSVKRDVVQSFLDDSEVDNIICYQGDLSSRYIMEIVSGEGRDADESETEIVTYRMRASEYANQQVIKKYETDEDKYLTDEDNLAEVPPEPEPEVVLPSIDILTNIYYTVGANEIERTLFTFIQAQYLALNGKTLIVESDVQYHRLSDMVLKSKTPYVFINIQDFIDNCSGVLNRIKNESTNLIVLGCIDRTVYDYNFIMDLLISNLTGYVDYFVKECDYSQTPYGCNYTIVCEATVPEVLRCVNSLKYDVDETKVIMIGLRTRNLNELSITSSEMTSIVQVLLNKNKLHAEVVSAEGINLKGDEITYDVFSLISRGNERQG